jgi:A/G-specific adenine glycosylase
MTRTLPRPLSVGKLPDTVWNREFGRRLLAWYRRHKRDLPWRRTRDPYAIWVSEIMLQQTQVATVIPYYQRFMVAFPTVRSLAAADEHDVLCHWEGLGYYRRARQMHRAARVIVEQHGGRFPRDPQAVRALPGIGRYTAGAIASIAFDARAPILEANTVRLLSRLVAYRGDTANGAGQRRLWQVAEAVLPKRGCGTFNQALMELGSLICTPRAPGCERCPVRTLCAAQQAGQQEKIPRPAPKQQFESVREAAVIVWRNGKVLLRRREPGERWAGLWDFLRFRVDARQEPALRCELLEKIRGQCGLSVESPEHVATWKHGVTRFRITLDCFAGRCTSNRVWLAAGTWQWVRPNELGTYPLSTTGRKIAEIVRQRGSNGQSGAVRRAVPARAQACSRSVSMAPRARSC